MKQIITIGFDIPSLSENYETFDSSQSLLDAEIIIFCPDISCYEYYSSFQGKPSFNENTSFRLKEDSSHWHQEILTALQEGKNVFIIMTRYEEVYVCTGRTEYSGSGRNARATNIVEVFSNYNFLPVQIPTLIPKAGAEIIFNNNPIFSSFWAEMKEYLFYESYLDGKIDIPLFYTKTGHKPIGGIFKIGKGNLILLPQINYPDSFTAIRDNGNNNTEECWGEEAIKFGKRFIQIISDIDNELKQIIERTPPPDWVLKKEYQTNEEGKIKRELGDLSVQIDKLMSNKTVLMSKLQKEGELRWLLYEKGKPLEAAIIRALEIIGYKTENFEDENMEIDQIIVSPEGNRFIGEAEGKDNAAINIDKFRQLESNIQEDLQREEVTEAAIGILFGNGFRLIAPERREEQFTDKCIKNAARLHVVIMRTADLFKIAKYVKETNDVQYAKECRNAILNSRGKIVVFPEAKNE